MRSIGKMARVCPGEHICPNMQEWIICILRVVNQAKPNRCQTTQWVLLFADFQMTKSQRMFTQACLRSQAFWQKVIIVVVFY